jgi:nitroreductase
MTPFDLAETDRLLSTTRAVRKRLDFDRPVPRNVLLDCIRLAQQAPTGSNRQGWRWIIVTEPDKRRALADIYRKGAGTYLSDSGAKAEAAGDRQTARVYDSAQYLAENMEKAPALVIPCIRIDHLPEDPPRRVWAGLIGSIMPAVWSFQLALRARGLGSTLTTIHLQYADEAADLLGLPEGLMQTALLPVAYTKGLDFKPVKRQPVEEIVHWNSWDASRDGSGIWS